MRKEATLGQTIKGTDREKKSPWRGQSINLEPGIFIESYNTVESSRKPGRQLLNQTDYPHQHQQ